MGPAVKVKLGQLVARVDERSPRLLIGRDLRCGLVSEDTSVSRRHAEIFLANGKLYIRDLGSANGTWVNGQAVVEQPAQLRAGQEVFIGQLPLQVGWLGPGGGETMVGRLPAELKKFIAEKEKNPDAAPPWAPPPLSQEQVLGVGGAAGPAPAQLTYRREGRNSNGALLIALPGDTFSNAGPIEGHVEYTALDNETVSSIILELVEHYKGEPKGGHVWDRVLVRQGPWKSEKGDVLGMPFQLRVPPGTSVTGGSVSWELRGLVDIAWAFDVQADAPITMRNIDAERLRDAMGAIDYRVIEVESEPMGQRFEVRFQPPPSMPADVTEVVLEAEYLGSDLKVELRVKRGKLRSKRKGEITFALTQLRTATLAHVSQYLQEQVEVLRLG
jgi:hypothetical protein